MRPLATLAGLSLLLGSACSSTASLEKSWRDPQVRDFAAQKTVVVVMSGEINYRRLAEGEFVRRLGAGRSGHSYDFLDAPELANPKQAAALAREHGFDSALVVRVIGMDGSTYTPENPLTFSGQSFSTARLWPAAGVEGEPDLKHTFSMQSDLFALGDDKLVWSGVVEIRNPDSSHELAQLNAEAVLYELRAQKLLR